MDSGDKDDNDKRNMLEGKNSSSRYPEVPLTIDFQATPPSWLGVIVK
jgi:hypothetical protein